MRSAVARTLTAALAVAALVGCAPADAEPAPTPEATVASSPETAPAPPAPEPPTFVMVSTCSKMLGPVLESQILGTYVLFSSTPGAGIHYPIASTQTSGSPLSCWYGVDGVDLSSFEIAAQPIADRAAVEAGLAGFASTTEGDVTTWVQEGTQGGAPAVVHVVRPDSWLTGYSAYGGSTQVATLTGYLATVADNLYE